MISLIDHILLYFFPIKDIIIVLTFGCFLQRVIVFHSTESETELPKLGTDVFVHHVSTKLIDLLAVSVEIRDKKK